MSKNKYTETELVEGCIKNNRYFQELLYRRYAPSMIRLCLKAVPDRDTALMIVNNGFLKVFKKIDQYTFQGSFQGWVRKIVYRSISDYYRNRPKLQSKVLFIEHDTSEDTSPLTQLYFDDLLELIDCLPPITASVFHLFAIEGYKHQEVASFLNISEGTSKWHLSEARRRLKELINLKRNDYHAG